MIGKILLAAAIPAAVCLALADQSGGAKADDASSVQPIGYRVELTGTPDMKFRLKCRTWDDGHAAYRPHFNTLPQTYEYGVDTIWCVVFKKEHFGDVQMRLVALYPSPIKDRVIGTASSQDYPTSIFARSRGPWGPEAVATAVDDDLVLPPKTSAASAP